MKKILTYKDYITERHTWDWSDLNYTINEFLIKIGTEYIDSNDELEYDFSGKDIEEIFKDNNFINKLKEHELEISGDLESTGDYETFLERQFRYFTISDKVKNEENIEVEVQAEEKSKNNPLYLVIQNNKRVKLYKYEYMDNFYRILTNKKIEIRKGDKNYIYQTTNAGNDWMLLNIDSVSNEFLKSFRREEFMTLCYKFDNVSRIIE